MGQDRTDGQKGQPEQEHYLFESRQLGSVLDVSQAGALGRQLLRDALVLGVLRGQDQAGMVAQLPQVLQRLRGGEDTWEGTALASTSTC